MLGKHMGAEYIIFGFPRGAFRVVAERNMRRLDYLHEANMGAELAEYNAEHGIAQRKA
jgi:hypothetical protein